MAGPGHQSGRVNQRGPQRPVRDQRLAVCGGIPKCGAPVGGVVLQHRVLLVFGEPPLPRALRTRGPRLAALLSLRPLATPPGTFPGLPTTSPLIAASLVLQSRSAVPSLSRTPPPSTSILQDLTLPFLLWTPPLTPYILPTGCSSGSPHPRGPSSLQEPKDPFHTSRAQP